MIQNPERVLFAWRQSEEEGAMYAHENPEKVKSILEFIRNSYIEGPSGILNLFEHGRYYSVFGNVSLIEGCSSNIHITIGMDAWDSGEILIDKEEIIEIKNPLKSGYDFSLNYFNKGRRDNKFAINIYCENVDRYLLKDYLTGVSEKQLQCIDVPNCDDVDTDLPYNASEEITNILKSIRDANLNNQLNIKIQWPAFTKETMIGCDVNLYDDLTFRIGIRKDLYAATIHTNMKNVSYDSYNRPSSRWETVKGVLNDFGANFDIGEFSGEEKLRSFRFTDVNNSNHNLIIVIEDRYTNILGHYLFGENWEVDFSDMDRQWVLYIYSPEISRKFDAVKDAVEGNLLEQRRLTYYALTNQFSDKSINRSSGGSNSFLGNYNYSAQLKHNPSATTKGVTVYTYKNGINGIEISETPIQYDHRPILNKNDVFYPVDVNLWDGDNNKPSLGIQFYKDFDFIGKYHEGTFAVGPPTGGGGVISGYLRGFGYNEFHYAGVGASATYTLEVSGAIGMVEGKYIGRGKPTPLNFSGPGTDITVSAADFKSPIGFALSSWQGFNERGVLSWNGITTGLDITFGLRELGLPGSVDFMRIQTDLHFPSPNKTTQETLGILNNNSYYVGE